MVPRPSPATRPINAGQTAGPGPGPGAGPGPGPGPPGPGPGPGPGGVSCLRRRRTKSPTPARTITTTPPPMPYSRPLPPESFLSAATGAVLGSALAPSVDVSALGTAPADFLAPAVAGCLPLIRSRKLSTSDFGLPARRALA